jgi:DNA-binding NarL/FixJ family response regulator
MVELVSAISTGGSPLTPNVARTVLGMMRGGASGVRPPEETRFGGRGAHLVLSKREQEVLRDLARGLLYKQIAEDLGISIYTVRTYVRRIYEKLRVGTTAEAVAAAIRDGIA